MYMKQCLSLFSAHLSICITENESYSRKEITLPRAIVTDNDIVLGRERFDHSLLLIASGNVRTMRRMICASDTVPFEALYDDLLDIHGCK